MTLEQANQNIGNEVCYKPFNPFGYENQSCEYGTITRVNSTCVFVRYRGYDSIKATYANDLTLIGKEKIKWH